MAGDLDSTQVSLLGEECLLLDRDDRVIGYGSKKECHLVENIEKRGLLHRAFSIFLFDSKGRLLLQQRASEKITFPDYWTNTVCSHPLRGDEEEEKDAIGVRRAAQRKIEHELGIKAADLPLESYKYITRLHYKAASDPVWGEHEIDYILIAQANVAPAPNPNEVRDTRYVTPSELRELLDSENPQSGVRITPWFKLICNNFLFKWWDELTQLDKFVDHKTIHRL